MFIERKENQLANDADEILIAEVERIFFNEAEVSKETAFEKQKRLESEMRLLKEEFDKLLPLTLTLVEAEFEGLYVYKRIDILKTELVCARRQYMLLHNMRIQSNMVMA